MAVVGTATMHATFTGRNGSGAVSIAGTKAGDWVLGAYRPNDDQFWAPNAGGFEAIITVDGEIQQLSSNDLSADTIKIVLIRPLS